jgi:alpha-tubulin suppressor-like RCC1 family protein
LLLRPRHRTVNGDGQLGNGTTSSSTTPVAVANLSGVTAIPMGTYSTCALPSGETVECWGWGDNSCGQLGNGATTSTPVPVVW